MKSYKLSTLFFLVVIVALCVSQMVMIRQLAESSAEIDSVRRKYGHISINDAGKTYVARIIDNEQNQNAWRIRVPAGSRYLLHLTDATFGKSDYLDDPIPTETISLNGWQEGADVVLSYSIRWENNAPRVVVHTETEQLFDYAPPNWVKSTGPREGSQLTPKPQAEFSVDDTIRFMWWRDPSTKRGIMLWLEPVESASERASDGASRAEELLRSVAKARESLETGTVTIAIEVDGEKNQQRATFDLTRVQFVGQTESGKRSGEAAMWDGDAVTVVSRFGTEGVRIVGTGTSPAFLFDPRCIGIQGPLSQSSSVEDELSLARATSFELVKEKETVDGMATVVIRVNYADGFGEKEYYRQFWIADTEGFPVLRHKLVLGQHAYYESASTYTKDSSVYPLPEKTVLTGFGTGGKKLIEYKLTLSNANYNWELDKESFSYKALGILPKITITDERIHRQIGVWDGNELVPFPLK